MKHTLLSILLVATIATGHAAESRDAFVPGEIWPDNNGVHINAHGGGMLRHGDTWYWFGEHKIEGGAGNVAHVGVHVYSSQDLYNWKDEGIALSVSNDPQSPLVKGCIIERPKVIHNPKTGKFVMWFHHELTGRGYDASLSGVAVADKVTGPYTYIESFRPNAGAWPANVPEEMKKPLTAEEADMVAKAPMRGDFVPDNVKDMVFRRDHDGGQMARDMTLFVDDDGKAYHIYSSESNSTLHLSQLTDDFLKPAGKFIRLFPMRFNEAPAMFKRNGKYFLISSGCTGWAPNAARLASADKLSGPWTEHGNPCVGPDDQIATTFNSQSTFVLPVPGKKDAFIFMADRWNAGNAIDGRYIWLPLQFKPDGLPFIEWKDRWDLGVFQSK